MEIRGKLYIHHGTLVFITFDIPYVFLDLVRFDISVIQCDTVPVYVNVIVILYSIKDMILFYLLLLYYANFLSRKNIMFPHSLKD